MLGFCFCFGSVCYFSFLDGDIAGKGRDMWAEEFLFLFKKREILPFSLLCKACFSHVTRMYAQNVLFFFLLALQD